MKYLRHLFLLSALLLLATACEQEEQKGGIPEEIKLVLNIPGATTSKSVDAEATEKLISNVYLLFYKQSASETDTPSAFYSATGLNGAGSWKQTFKTTDFPALEAYTTYDVYVLASLTTGTTAPTDAMTKKAFLEMQEAQFARTAATPGISFTGKTTYETGTLGELKIDLTRTVARFDVTVTGSTFADGKMWVADEPAYTYYNKPAGATDAPITQSKLFDMIKISDTKFSCYIYEKPGSEKIRLCYSKDNTKPNSFYFPVDVTQAIKRNYIYNISLTIKEGSVDILTETLPWTDQVDNTLTGDEPLTVAPAANSYLLKPGEEIYIPVTQIDNASKTYSTIPAVTNTDHFTSELVWQDQPDLLAEVASIGMGPEAVLKVKAGSGAGTEGNAVVAVKDKTTGDIRWSWHIWVTDYNPDAAGNNHPVPGASGDTRTYTFMDRNLGALKYVTTAVNPLELGLYYQWARKDPFPKPATWVPGTYNPEVYDLAGNVKTIIASDKTKNCTLQDAIKYPATFIEKNINYISSVTDKAWGGEYESATADIVGKVHPKTVLDPCPPGWRIPPASAVKPLFTEFATITTIATGYLSTSTFGAKQMYFPTGGWLWGTTIGALDGEWIATGTTTFSSTSTSGPLAIMLLPHLDPKLGYTDQVGDTTSGVNVRCVKDNLETLTP